MIEGEDVCEGLWSSLLFELLFEVIIRTIFDSIGGTRLVVVSFLFGVLSD